MNRTTFSTYTGKSVTLEAISGEVLEASKHSTTEIHSRGGGGYVSAKSGGYVSAPSVSSTSTTHQEIWLRTSEGTEVPVQLSGADAPVRAGQQVVAFKASTGTKQIFFALGNKTSKQLTQPEPGHMVLRALGLQSSAVLLLHLLIGGAIYVGMQLLSESLGDKTGWGLIAGIVLGPLYVVVQTVRLSKRAGADGKKVDDWVQGVFSEQPK